MSIVKRSTAARKVVSRRDPSWRFTAHVQNAYIDYCNTLDMAIVEKCGTLPDPLTVFEILPLKVTHEVFVDGKDSNWWEIFRAHVTQISGMQLEMQGDKIKDSLRNEIGPEVIEDIARMIVDLSNADGVSIFFTLPVGYWEFLQNCQRLLVKEMAQSEASKEIAPSEAAQANP